ncbi:hypothetical protein BASA82_001244 [Batrachochytrium salamandrivorans]|nr:hypothetical protein BASA82_001244 [Batrachochytrium salamandrivorans]
MSHNHVKEGSKAKYRVTVALTCSAMDLDEYFKRKVRKVLPFLDNAPVHIVNETTDLTNVEFCYFPPHLTSYQFFSLLMLALSKVWKALSRKFEVLSLLDLMKDSSIHASDLAKNTDSSGRNQVYVEILGPSYGRDNPEMFCQMLVLLSQQFNRITQPKY